MPQGGGQTGGMFRSKYQRGVCSTCGVEAEHRSKVPKHRTHFILTVVTGGLWGVSWVAATVFARTKGYECLYCRTVHDRPPRGNLVRGTDSTKKLKAVSKAEPAWS